MVEKDKEESSAESSASDEGDEDDDDDDDDRRLIGMFHELELNLFLCCSATETFCRSVK